MTRCFWFGLIALLMISGCQGVASEPEEIPCEHEWQEATCEEPSTCAICGEKRGLPLGHKYGLATFEHPKTCEICRTTLGNALGSQTYSTEDNLIGYRLEGDKRFIYAGWGDMNLEINIFDENDELIYDKTWNYSAPATLSHGSNKDVALVLIGFEEAWKVHMLDWNGEEICTTSLSPFLEAYYRTEFENHETRDWEDLWLAAYLYEDFPMIRVVRKDDNRRICYVDYRDGEVYKELPSHLNLPEMENTAALEGWAYAKEEKVIDGYFVGNNDGTEWGYLNKAGEVIALYKDATSFIGDYALVSADGISYDLIGSDMSVISPGLLMTDGSGVSVRSDGLANAFIYRDTDSKLLIYELIMS